MCHRAKPIVFYSAVLSQFEDSAIVAKWIFDTIQHEKNVSLKTTNILVSKLLDVFFGLLVLFYVLKYEQEITIFVHYITKVSKSFVLLQIVKMIKFYP